MTAYPLFQWDAQWAKQADEKDKLAPFRKRFLFPQHQGRSVLYFTGNSLGLQPVSVQETIQQELTDWAKWGVEGHFLAKRPWFNYHELFPALVAPIVGALPEEVVVMNQLTVNLHLLLISFYRPSGKRRKILFEHKPFPSDHYAFESQALLHGLDPADVLVEMQPRPGETLLRTEEIIAKIEELGEELATVCMGGVNYYTGQWFDMEAITRAAHLVGATCGFDLAHAAGNVPVKLHEWQVDYACWCSYKYLNSGPGGVSGVFVHQNNLNKPDTLRLAGWWGHQAGTRFLMQPGFDPMPTAEAWQLSNAPILSMAAHYAALNVFAETSMSDLREKSLHLSAYLMFVIEQVAAQTQQPIEIINPKTDQDRGAQVSVRFIGRNKSLVEQLAQAGVVVDWREPDTVRFAPVPLYNSYTDVYELGQILLKLLS